MNSVESSKTLNHLYGNLKEMQTKFAELESVYNLLILQQIKQNQKRRNMESFQARQACMQKEIDQKMAQWGKQQMIASLKEEKELLLQEETNNAIARLKCETERRRNR